MLAAIALVWCCFSSVLCPSTRLFRSRDLPLLDDKDSSRSSTEHPHPGLKALAKFSPSWSWSRLAPQDPQASCHFFLLVYIISLSIDRVPTSSSCMHSSKPSSPGFPRPAGYGILARHPCKPCSLEFTETAPAATGPGYRQTPLQEIHQAYERFSCWTEKILPRIFFAGPLGWQKRGGRGDQESKDLRGGPDHELVGDQGLIIRRQALTLLVRRHSLTSICRLVCVSVAERRDFSTPSSFGHDLVFVL
jgi:hypothetical protein